MIVNDQRLTNQQPEAAEVADMASESPEHQGGKRNSNMEKLMLHLKVAMLLEMKFKPAAALVLFLNARPVLVNSQLLKIHKSFYGLT